MVIGTAYLTLDRHWAAEQPVEPAGWDDLLPCSYTASFDGTKNLGFSEDGSVTLYDPSAKGGSIDGNWTFDGTAKLYTVIVNGEAAAYSVVAPGSANCMLIKGNPSAADLRSSWFSSPVDDGPGDGLDDDR